MRLCGLLAYAGYLLVAPVKIGKDACIGSGSVITKDVLTAGRCSASCCSSITLDSKSTCDPPAGTSRS